MSRHTSGRGTQRDKDAAKNAVPAPHGDNSCTLKPADRCNDPGDCMSNGCLLHGRTGKGAKQ